jgi:Tfp pilus assembly protein PilN
VLPANVWLTALSMQQSGGAGGVADAATSGAATSVPGQAAPVPSAVSIQGYTYTQPDVALLLARLSTLPTLSRVTLTSSQVETVSKKKVVQFVIVADLNQNGGGS